MRRTLPLLRRTPAAPPPCVGLFGAGGLPAPGAAGRRLAGPPHMFMFVPKFLKIIFKVEGFQNEGRGARGYL